MLTSFRMMSVPTVWRNSAAEIIGDAHWIVTERLDVVRRCNQDTHGERRRQARKHPARDAAVRGDDAHLPLHLEALANHVRQVAQNFGEIAAALTLRQHGGHEEPGVEQWDALGKRLERVAQRHAEVLLIVENAELARDGLRRFFRNDCQPGCKGVSGAQRACNQLDRLRKLLLELLHSLLRLEADDEERHERQQGANGEPEPMEPGDPAD